MMNRERLTLCGLLVPLLLSAFSLCAFGQDDKGNQKSKGDQQTKTETPQAVDRQAGSDNPAAHLAAEHLKAALEWQSDYRKAPKEERAEVLKQRPSFAAYAVKFQKLAKENEGTAIAATAYAWLSKNAPGEDKLTAFQTMVDRYHDAHELGNLTLELTSYGKPTKRFQDQLETIVDDSRNPAVRGAATYALILHYERCMKLAEKEKTDRALRGMDEKSLKYLKELRIEDSEFEKLYRSLATDYRDVDVMKMGRKINLGEMADAGLFNVNHLSVGTMAPDIEAADLDGVAFKLSDYRGKIVMLDFWGDW